MKRETCPTCHAAIIDGACLCSEASAVVAPSAGNALALNFGDRAEAALLRFPQGDAAVFHHFGPGIYIRELHIPPGEAVGHRHKLEHLNVMLTGHLTLIDEETGAQRELVAPVQFVAPPGRKIAIVHKPTIWWNIIATNERDIDKLEALMLDKSDEWKTAMLTKRALEHVARNPDRADFVAFLAEAGLVEPWVRAVSENLADQIEMPDGWPKFTVRDSMIEGRGVFVSAPVVEGEVIAPARIGDKRTPAGRYTNHSPRPNAHFVRENNGDISLVALRAIAGAKGGDQGEEVTVDYRQALAVNLGGAR